MKRHALSVGVNDYADTAFKNLRYSLSNALALSGAIAAIMLRNNQNQEERGR